jgi:3-oxoacid CoA-transferase subunit A
MFPVAGQRANFRDIRSMAKRANTEGLSVIDKLRADVMSVLDVVSSGASLAVGGFGSSGRPDTLLDALCDLDRRDLHLIVNNVGSDFTGVGRMLAEGRIRRLTASFPVLPEFYDEYFAGRVELELVPQGTLAERLRAGGAGIPAFYTPASAGTMLSDGTFPLRYTGDRATAECLPEREVRDFGGREHVLEYGIVADFGLVRAFQGDRKGNLRFHLSARNFNPLAGMSGRRVFAEIQHLVEVDELHPDDIHLPGVFVDDVLLASASSPKQPTIAGFRHD